MTNKTSIFNLRFLGRLMMAVLYVLMLSSCGRNPFGAIPDSVTKPPILHEQSFEEHIATLKTPSHTAFWVNRFAVYDLGYNWNWSVWERLGFPDQAYALAHSMWKEYHEGKSRGVCGQFAATYVVAAREHGYKCGGLCTWGPNWGHAQGWIIESDGSVSLTDNKKYLKSKFSNWDKFLKYARDHDYYEVLNDKFEITERGGR